MIHAVIECGVLPEVRVFTVDIVPLLFEPLKPTAPFTCPIVQMGLVRVMLLAFTDESKAVVPDPSSSFQQPMRPVVGVQGKVVMIEKVAVTFFTLSMVSVQVVLVPVHDPDQLEKVDPEAGEAVRVTVVPWG